MNQANPLRQTRPPKNEALYQGKFFPALPNGKYQSEAAFVRYKVILTQRVLWISDELCIPIQKIKSVEIIDKFLNKALGVTYENPITGGGLEQVFICKLDPIGIGLYRKAPLVELAAKIEAAKEAAPAEDPEENKREITDGFLSPEKDYSEADEELRPCEVCGAKPAYYIGHVFLLGAFVIWLRSGEQRRVHCKKHALLQGGWRYLVTAGTGWLGISIIGYPFLVIRTALNLKPAVGGWSYLLAVLPLPFVAYAVYAFVMAVW
jgi:hypothetical protein